MKNAYLKIKFQESRMDMVVCDYNSSDQEAEVRGLLKVQGQPCLNSETLPEKKISYFH